MAQSRRIEQLHDIGALESGAETKRFENRCEVTLAKYTDKLVQQYFTRAFPDESVPPQTTHIVVLLREGVGVKWYAAPNYTEARALMDSTTLADFPNDEAHINVPDPRDYSARERRRKAAKRNPNNG